MKNKCALIFGISGQDGSLLAKLLLEKGYEVHGTSRNVSNNPFKILSSLGIKKYLRFHSVKGDNSDCILNLIEKVKPDEIYNLSGQSSVGLSFEEPLQTMHSIVNPTLGILEALRKLRLNTRFYHASSGEMFGDTPEPADELTPFSPKSPYAVAKTAAHHCVKNYRDAFQIYACSGILFNHESQYRPSKYVTQKIAESAVRISLGLQDCLILGNLEISRDWGWAEEYVQAMWLMLQQDKPEDYVIATGKTYPLIEFIHTCFKEVGLEAEKWIRVDPNIIRPNDVKVSRANPRKANEILKWKAKLTMHDVARKMTQEAFLRLKDNAS